ncbi:uncharacterized protein [Rutidosis leptorrhynchoides]|uniref:uncharacterized protein n=1 Tax=Rutidosis leptorrhynchoides TaxID=125765 RepID=UPI003A99CA22
MTTLLLPRFFILESGGRYLRVTEASQPSLGLLKFDEEQIWSPRVKFAVERAETTSVDDVGQQLVHIRSCYNNKYWEALPDKTTGLISASGKKPEEDRSKVSCTLFEIEPVQGNTGALRLRFVQNGRKYAGRLLPDSTSNVAIHDGVTLSAMSSTLSEFNVINAETLVILPKEVSFTSEDLDGYYLVSRTLDTWWPYQRFESGMDVGDPLVAKELSPLSNGNYRVYDLHFAKFWIRTDTDWVRADAKPEDSSNKDTFFEVVKVSDTIVSLRNLGNNKFCGAITKEGKDNCLIADYPNISRQVRLMIQERVLHREISDIKYRLTDSRIYEEEIQEVSNAFANNESETNESTITLKYSVSESKTTHWTNSISISLGVSVEFKVSVIPLIESGTVKTETNFSETYEWGVSETRETTREATYTVVVPPLTSVKVTLMATKAACDVPFSYTQTDLLTTGETVITIKDDGVYTGINSYNFHFQSTKVTKDAQGRFLF